MHWNPQMKEFGSLQGILLLTIVIIIVINFDIPVIIVKGDFGGYNNSYKISWGVIKTTRVKLEWLWSHIPKIELLPHN